MHDVQLHDAPRECGKAATERERSALGSGEIAAARRLATESEGAWRIGWRREGDRGDWKFSRHESYPGIDHRRGRNWHRAGEAEREPRPGHAGRRGGTDLDHRHIPGAGYCGGAIVRANFWSGDDLMLTKVGLLFETRLSIVPGSVLVRAVRRGHMMIEHTQRIELAMKGQVAGCEMRPLRPQALVEPSSQNEHRTEGERQQQADHLRNITAQPIG